MNIVQRKKHLKAGGADTLLYEMNRGFTSLLSAEVRK